MGSQQSNKPLDLLALVVVSDPRSTATLPDELEELEARELVDGGARSRQAHRAVLPDLVADIVIP